MEKNKLAEMYKLIEKAKILDKVGKESDSLEIYLDILKNYFPNTSFCYERPAIILEKKKRYQEAKDICLKAVELIDSQKLGGTSEKFKSKIERLDQKMSQEIVKAPKKKSKKFNTNIFKLLGLLVSFVLVIGFIVYMFIPKESPYKEIYIDMDNLDREVNLEGSIFVDKNGNDLPQLTSSMIEYARGVCNDNPEVDNSLIVVQQGTLGFGILLNQAISKDRAKEIGKEFITALSKAASDENKEFSAPMLANYGSLYDSYDSILAIGFSSNDIAYRATMNKKTNVLFWRK